MLPRFALPALVVLVVPVLAAVAAGQDTAVLEGVVLDESGAGAAGATVVVGTFGTSETSEAVTGADGRFRHTGLTDGIYTVTANRADLGADLFRVRLRSGQTVQVTLALERGRSMASWLTEAGEREALTRAFDEGLAASRAGRIEEAIAAYERAVEIGPTCLECRFNLAVAYADASRFDAAEETFRAVLEIRPGYAAAYYGLSSVYARQGRTDEAAEARGEANRIALELLAAGRAQAEDAVARGATFLEAGNVQDAVGRFEAALDHDANYAPAHYWLGVAHMELEQPERARAALSRYVAIEPNGELSDDARQRLDQLER